MSNTSKTEAGRPAASKPPKRRRWRRRLLVGGAVVLVLYTLFGFFGVPWLLRGVGMKELSKRIAGETSLERATFNPFTLRLVLEGFEARDETQELALAFDRFEGNFQALLSIFRPGFRFAGVQVDKPFVRASVDRAGRLNLAQMLWPNGRPERKPLEAIPRVVTTGLGIAEARIELRHETSEEPFELVLDDLSFELDELDTAPQYVNTYRLAGVTGKGATIAWEGSFNLDPLSSAGSLEVTGADLPRFMPYAAAFLDGQIVSGRLSSALTYDFAPAAAAPRAEASIATAKLEDVRITHGDRGVIALSDVAVTGVEVDAVGRTLAVDRVETTRTHVQADWWADGEFPIAMLLQQLARSGDAAPAARGDIPDHTKIEYPIARLVAGLRELLAGVTDPWTVVVERIETSETSIGYRDERVEPQVTVDFTAMTVSAGPVRSDQNFKIPFTLKSTVGGGTFELQGEAEPGTLAADVRVRADGVDLTLLAPYLPREIVDPLPPIELMESRITLDGTLVGAFDDDGALDGTWSGDARLDDLRIVDASAGDPVTTLAAIAVNGDAEVRLGAGRLERLAWKGRAEATTLDLAAPLRGPVQVAADGLVVDGDLEVLAPAEATTTVTFRGTTELTGASVDAPEVQASAIAVGRATIGTIDFSVADQRLAIESVEVETPDVAAVFALLPGAQTESATPIERRALGEMVPYLVTIDTVNLHGGVVEVRDESTQPPAVVALNDVSIEGGPLQSDGQAETELTIKGRMEESARFSVRGRMNPFPASPTADLDFELAALPATAYAPLIEPYLGYAIESGRVTVEFPFTLTNDEVQGDLHVVLDDFHLGEKVETEHAPDVPIKLGLDLLRDGNDRVDATIPVKGKITDPEFSVKGLILDAFFGLIGKAATAPFTLLASAFGGGDADISQVEFDAGSADLSATGAASLDVLVRAMAGRPALSLSATGHFGREEDVAAMRAAALRAQMLERVQRGNRLIKTLTDEAYRESVSAAYAQQGGSSGEAASFEQMEAALLDAIDVTDEQLVELAQRRLDAVVNVLVAEGGVPEARVTAEVSAESDAPHVTFDVK